MAGGYTVDLAELKKLADVYLQDLADVYDNLNHKVAGTACFDGLAFQAYPTSASGGPDSVYPHWSSLRDELCDYLADTSTSYQSAVTAMHHTIQMYAEAERVSASAINAVYRKMLAAAASIGDVPANEDPQPVIIR